jgi:hypothetical protein
MESRRVDLFGDGSVSRPLMASSEPLPRHPGLTAEASVQRTEMEPEQSGAFEAVAQAVAEAAVAPSGIGELRYLEPRELWPDGEGELLAWLAQHPEPLSVATGLSLRPAAEGTPRTDEGLLLQTDTGDPVVVVLDLGESSDNTLGRLMRIVAATDAKAAIWAAASARSEHLASLSWLNRMVAERSYIIQLRGVRIDDSRPAPIFGPLLRPPRHDDRPPAPPSPPADTKQEYGRRADDWPTVSLIERGAEQPD